MVDAGDPFGLLPLIDEVVIGESEDTHGFVESAPGVSEVQDILVSREIESERLRQIEMESADKNDKEEQVLEQGYNDRSQINNENMEPRVHDRSDATVRGAGGKINRVLRSERKINRLPRSVPFRAPKRRENQ